MTANQVPPHLTISSVEARNGELLIPLTLGQKLTKEQMRIAFESMQKCFSAFEGKVIAIGLAKTNPHEDILMMELKRPIGGFICDNRLNS